MPVCKEHPMTPRTWVQRFTSFCGNLFVGLVVCVLFFAVLEITLRIAGWPPRDFPADPFVGYSGTSPLYEVNDGVATTVEHKIHWFNLVHFKAHKPRGTYRIFCFGGSTTYGSPYDKDASFTRWLEDLLEASAPGKEFEVINAGGLSYASYRIVHLVRETLQYNPDLVVIYTGHNEFLERRTYSNLFAQGPILIALRSAVEELSIYHALKALLTPLLPDLGKNQPVRTGEALQEQDVEPSASKQEEASSHIEQENLPVEVRTILDEGVVGPEAYVRDEQFHENVIRHFSFNMKRIVSLCKDAGIPVILVEPASKLNDCPPFRSQHGAGLGEQEIRSMDEQHDSVHELLKERRFSEALSLVEEDIRQDPLYAEFHYLRGKALLGLGRNSEALESFVKARDLDVCPLRCISALEDRIREIARGNDVLLVPFRESVFQHARENGSKNGVPGKESFLDHVHPTLELHQKLAELILATMIDHRLVVPSKHLTADERSAIYRKGVAEFDRDYLAMKDLRLGRLLMWAGQNQQARVQLEKAAGGIEDAWTVELLARLLLRLGSKETAIREYRRALKLSDGDPYLHLDLANAYLQSGSRDKAMETCKAIIAGDRSIPEARGFLGMMYIEDGMPGQALELADEGLKTHPGHPSLLAAKSLALATSGKASEAIPLMITAVERDVNNVINLVQLARICLKMGESDEALQCLDAAVDTGGVSAEMIVSDPTFQPVKGLPEFKRIVKKAKDMPARE